MKQEFVTLPRAVVEQAIAALTDLAGWRAAPLCDLLRAALEQPQNHVPDAGNMVPAGWKLVPVEPTEEMLRAGCGSESPAMFRESLRRETDGPKTVEMVKKIVQRHLESYRAMLAAAPQPPTTEQSSAVEQQQGEQEPVAEVIESHVRAGLDGRFTAVVAGRERLSVGAEIFVHPQLQREPLTRERIRAIQHELSDTVGCSYETMARAIEAAHNIK